MLQDLDTLTPTEYHGLGLWLKRDDKFQPFGPYHVNGGKVRQAFKIFETKQNELKTLYDGGVITAASVHSPQSANIAKVAAYYGIKCLAVVGGTTEKRLEELDMMRLTRYYGCDVKIVAKYGMTNTIHARMHEMAKKLNYMPIEMGELMQDNPASIFESTANQVQNIPDNLTNLVVPTGVAIQLTGILIGLKRYNKKVDNIYSICVGPTREKQVANYFKTVYNEDVSNYHPFKMIAHKAPYSKNFSFDLNFLNSNADYLDDIYEGKAYDWMTRNIPLAEKTLLWCVGKRPRNEEINFIIENSL